MTDADQVVAVLTLLLMIRVVPDESAAAGAAAVRRLGVAVEEPLAALAVPTAI
jgi:hypothetical protein